MKAFPKKITAGVLFACLAFQMTSCSLISKGLKQFDEHENERFTGILNETYALLQELGQVDA